MVERYLAERRVRPIASELRNRRCNYFLYNLKRLFCKLHLIGRFNLNSKYLRRSQCGHSSRFWSSIRFLFDRWITQSHLPSWRTWKLLILFPTAKVLDQIKLTLFEHNVLRQCQVLVWFEWWPTSWATIPSDLEWNATFWECKIKNVLN